jgi:hypothetical protein
MSPEEIKKLLGGYATGTLTAEEQQALFAAALEDQELFDSLAGEQALRDLLSDPASRAHLLTALDTPARRTFHFWEWLRRPVVAGLAVAGVGGIAVVAVLQSTHVPHKDVAAPQIVAELKVEPAPLQSTAEVPPPSMRQQADKKVNVPRVPPPALLPAPNQPVPAAPPPAAIPAAEALRKSETPAAEDKAAPRPEALPALMARKAEAQAVAVEQSAGARSSVSSGNVALDARALFYGTPLTPVANAFAPSGGGGAAAPPSRRAETAQADATARFSAAKVVSAPRLGVRISILRQAGEADLTTVLDPGETVRLKLIPNADGFLYISEGARLISSGAVQRLKPFETPEIRFEGSGQKPLNVLFSRRPQNVNPQSLGTLARESLVETAPGPERATYVVSGSGEADVQQIVVPVTLTYR